MCTVYLECVYGWCVFAIKFTPHKLELASMFILKMLSKTAKVKRTKGKRYYNNLILI